MDDRRQRVERRRATWTATLRRDGLHAPVGRLPPEEALAMMWEVSVTAWTLSGRPLPTYARHEMPVRVVRRGDGT